MLDNDTVFYSVTVSSPPESFQELPNGDILINTSKEDIINSYLNPAMTDITTESGIADFIPDNVSPTRMNAILSNGDNPDLPFFGIGAHVTGVIYFSDGSELSIRMLFAFGMTGSSLAEVQSFRYKKAEGGFIEKETHGFDGSGNPIATIRTENGEEHFNTSGEKVAELQVTNDAKQQFIKAGDPNQLVELEADGIKVKDNAHTTSVTSNGIEYKSPSDTLFMGLDPNGGGAIIDGDVTINGDITANNLNGGGGSSNPSPSFESVDILESSSPASNSLSPTDIALKRWKWQQYTDRWYRHFFVRFVRKFCRIWLRPNSGHICRWRPECVRQSVQTKWHF